MKIERRECHQQAPQSIDGDCFCGSHTRHDYTAGSRPDDGEGDVNRKELAAELCDRRLDPERTKNRACSKADGQNPGSPGRAHCAETRILDAPAQRAQGPALSGAAQRWIRARAPPAPRLSAPHRARQVRVLSRMGWPPH
jgi:hypothetical protein